RLFQYSGVIDQNVHATVLVDHFGYNVLDLVAIRDITEVKFLTLDHRCCHFLDIQTHHMTTFGGQPVGDGSVNALYCAGNDAVRTRQPLRDGARLSDKVIVCWCHEATSPAGGLPRSLPRRPSAGTAAVMPEQRGARLLSGLVTVQRFP